MLRKNKNKILEIRISSSETLRQFRNTIFGPNKPHIYSGKTEV